MRRVCILFFTVTLLGCGEPEQQTATAFDKFQQCTVRSEINDAKIAQGVKESCLQKHEMLSQKLLGMNVTANTYGQNQLQVSYTNAYDLIVTNIEIELKTPHTETGAACGIKDANCKVYFASGRTWIMPKERGGALLQVPTDLMLKNSQGERLWSFSVESIRYLSFDNRR
ncbi:MAG: hypothetical protein ACJAR0_003684 [Candidatus Azotimanducaceae bacterium]|jgi:hypothetical protein